MWSSENNVKNTDAKDTTLRGYQKKNSKINLIGQVHKACNSWYNKQYRDKIGKVCFLYMAKLFHVNFSNLVWILIGRF